MCLCVFDHNCTQVACVHLNALHTIIIIAFRFQVFDLLKESLENPVPPLTEEDTSLKVSRFPP